MMTVFTLGFYAWPMSFETLALVSGLLAFISTTYMMVRKQVPLLRHGWDAFWNFSNFHSRLKNVIDKAEHVILPSKETQDHITEGKAPSPSFKTLVVLFSAIAAVASGFAFQSFLPELLFQYTPAFLGPFVPYLAPLVSCSLALGVFFKSMVTSYTFLEFSDKKAAVFRKEAVWSWDNVKAVGMTLVEMGLWYASLTLGCYFMMSQWGLMLSTEWMMVAGIVLLPAVFSQSVINAVRYRVGRAFYQRDDAVPQEKTQTYTDIAFRSHTQAQREFYAMTQGALTFFMLAIISADWEVNGFVRLALLCVAPLWVVSNAYYGTHDEFGVDLLPTAELTSDQPGQTPNTSFEPYLSHADFYKDLSDSNRSRPCLN